MPDSPWAPRIYSPTGLVSTNTTTTNIDRPWGYWTANATTNTAGAVTVYANWVQHDGTFAIHDLSTATDSTTESVWNGWAIDAQHHITDVMERWCCRPITGETLGLIENDVVASLNRVTIQDIPIGARVGAQSVRPFELEDQKRKEERIKANDLAENLLRSCLDEAQKKELSDRDWFLVMTQSGKIYRINRGRVGNVDLLDENGKPIASYCIHNSGHTPSPDDMLLQKFLLDTDEEEFKRIANHRSAPYFGERRNVVDISRFRRAA